MATRHSPAVEQHSTPAPAPATDSATDSATISIPVDLNDGQPPVETALEIIWPDGKGLHAWHLLCDLGDPLQDITDALGQHLVTIEDASLLAAATGQPAPARSEDPEYASLNFDVSVLTAHQEQVTLQLVAHWPEHQGLYLLIALRQADTSEEGPLREVRQNLMARLIRTEDASVSAAGVRMPQSGTGA